MTMTIWELAERAAAEVATWPPSKVRAADEALVTRERQSMVKRPNANILADLTIKHIARARDEAGRRDVVATVLRDAINDAIRYGIWRESQRMRKVLGL